MVHLAAKVLAATLVSALAAVVGTVWHRAGVSVGSIDYLPLGIILGLAGILAVMVWLRAALGGAGLAGAALGTFVATQLVAQHVPGGGLLVHADALGYTWAFGALAMVALAAFCPRRWFSRT